jgi:NAD(P)H dehydrogenase (quinone)
VTIVVTGATGHVGGYVAEELSRRALPFRVIVRDPARAPMLPGADIVVADYGDPDALAGALEPGDRVFMVSVHEDVERRVTLHRSFVDVAADRRVGHVVYLSFVAAGPSASFRHARSHGATETMLAESGLPYTAVRNGMYADEIATWFDAEGRITGPGGDGRVSLSYRPELGEAIAALLADSELDRPLLTITGPEAVTLDELAAIASDVTGDPYRYEPLDREAWIAGRRALGRPEWAIDAGVTYFDGVRAGEADVVSDDYRELTGKQPLPIADVIAQRLHEMPLAGRKRET